MKPRTRTIAACLLLLSILASGVVGCGKYGPPERAEPAESSR